VVYSEEGTFGLTLISFLLLKLFKRDPQQMLVTVWCAIAFMKSQSRLKSSIPLCHRFEKMKLNWPLCISRNVAVATHFLLCHRFGKIKL
jgi:hypothetical protein